MNIQIAQLKYLLALAASGNYSIAAEACNVSQPALSMAIKKLEDELGFMVVDRKNNPISLTEKGKKIALQANIIIQKMAFNILIIMI